MKECCCRVRPLYGVAWGAPWNVHLRSPCSVKVAEVPRRGRLVPTKMSRKFVRSTERQRKHEPIGSHGRILVQVLLQESWCRSQGNSHELTVFIPLDSRIRLGLRNGGDAKRRTFHCAREDRLKCTTVHQETAQLAELMLLRQSRD